MPVRGALDPRGCDSDVVVKIANTPDAWSVDLSIAAYQDARRSFDENSNPGLLNNQGQFWIRDQEVQVEHAARTTEPRST